MRRLFVIFTALMVLALAAGNAFAEPTPTEDLRKSIDAVVELLGNQKMERSARRTEVVKRIRARFDFEAMSKFILGPGWRSATPEERTKFIELFTRTLETTYINRIEAYSDEKVKYLSEKRIEDKAKVETAVVHANKEIPIDYKVALKDGSWYVYDVSIEGVSLVRNYQETYAEIIRKDGMGGLLTKMTQKLSELENGKGVYK